MDSEVQNSKSDPMEKIDSHQHFWNFDPVRDKWITEEMQILRKDFLPQELIPVLKNSGFEGCIAVQAQESEKENHFLLYLASQNSYIKGIVGWLDFFADNIEERISYFSSFEKIKGFRYILQSAKDRALMLSPAFRNGLSKLRKFGFTYDILILEDQMPFVSELVAGYPEQLFVIDHLAKPSIKDSRIVEWKKQIQRLSVHENVFCKISGIVTEANWGDWKYSDLLPYLDVVFEAFGTKRVMYGSDWPVCLLAASYGQVLAVVKEYISTFSIDEQNNFWGGNASRFYKFI